VAAEFAEAGEDDEFAGAAHDGFVFHVPSVLVRDVNGVEADLEGGIDVAAWAVADHPALRLHNFMFADEAGVRDGVFFRDDFNGLKEPLETRALHFCGLFGGFAFGEKNQAVALGEISERFGNAIQNLGRSAFQVHDAHVNFRKLFALGLVFGELHVGFFKRTAEAADAVPELANVFALGFVEDVADVSAGKTVRLDESYEVFDQILEEDVVLPERIVGVNEEGIASHRRNLP